MKRLRLLALLMVTAWVGMTVYEAPPVDAHGWHYHRKKPPRKRPKPKKRKANYIQTDPIRMLKNFCDPSAKVGPNIIIAMDTSMRMQHDAEGYFYDERYWDANATYDPKKEPNPRTVATALGVSPTARYYRRKYKNLVRTQNAGGQTLSFTADSISVVDDQHADWNYFFDTSRLGMARDGLLQAAMENLYVVNWGLVRTRHGYKPTLPPEPGNQWPVSLTDPAQATIPGDILTSGGQTPQWKVTWLQGPKANLDTTSTSDTLLVPPLEKASNETAGWLLQPVDSNEDKTLRPAGADTASTIDSPVVTLLQDARAAVVRAMDHDDDKYRPCRNTAVILVVGGKDGRNGDAAAVASTFNAVTVKGTTRRVPVYVIGVGAPDADLPVLQAIADAGDGEFFPTYYADEIAFAGNYVAQSVFRRATEFDANIDSEFQVAAPIVGTVDLRNAKDIEGNLLPNTTVGAGGALSQGANVMVTTAFSLPGFEARIRAFRTYKPETDWSKQYGYAFKADNTRLWVAHKPATDQRNIFTHIPGVGYVAFTPANVAALKPYLGMGDDELTLDVINFVRQQPLGAPVSSTPALLAPPSLTPAPDSDYRSFADARRNRRSTLFYGGNDGMLHAIDGRLGVEVWAFIPFNMLPKLQTLLDGQPVDTFEYFVDASPKLADLKKNGAWRTYMFIGNGAGGTYYQAFDVSDAGLGVSPTSDSETAVVAQFSSPSVIPFAWSFPDMTTFDPTISNDEAPFGDVKASAALVAKQIGQTVSTPAIGQVGSVTSPWVMVSGSGYLSPSLQTQANRANVNAGTQFYVLDASTGELLASYDVGDDTVKESLKAALEADPSTTGPSESRLIDRAYIGDTEGAFYRFNLAWNGSTVTLAAPKKLYDASEWNPIYASAAIMPDGSGGEYVYVPVGIDTLPNTRIGQVSQFALVGLRDTGGTTATKMFELKLAKADSAGGDERPSSNPTIAGGIVFFTATMEYPDTPCRAWEARLYALMPPTGATAYDLTGDGSITTADRPYIAAAGRATAAYVVDNHLYFGTDSGVEIFGDPSGYNSTVTRTVFRTLAWRERR